MLIIIDDQIRNSIQINLIVIGYNIVNGKVETFDIQATLLNQLGFDHEKFTYESQGRNFRLTDVRGKVIHDIIA